MYTINYIKNGCTRSKSYPDAGTAELVAEAYADNGYAVSIEYHSTQALYLGE